jgi:hypothetical protein
LSKCCQKIGSKSCQKVVKKVAKNCQKVAKSCQKMVKKVVKKLTKSCQKSGQKLPKSSEFNKQWWGVGGLEWGVWSGGEIVVPRPSASALLTGRRQKASRDKPTPIIFSAEFLQSEQRTCEL